MQKIRMYIPDDIDLKDAHKGSIWNRDILRASDRCGCFYCLDVFDYVNISDWCDDNNTALCPSCGIDSVLGSSFGYPVTREFLEAMNKFWFGR